MLFRRFLCLKTLTELKKTLLGSLIPSLNTPKESIQQMFKNSISTDEKCVYTVWAIGDVFFILRQMASVYTDFSKIDVTAYLT